MRWNIVVEWVGEDGKQSKITLGTIERLAGSTIAENLGVNLREPKQITSTRGRLIAVGERSHEEIRWLTVCSRQLPPKGRHCHSTNCEA